MSNVAKPGGAAGSPPGNLRRDTGERPAKSGDFEAVLKDKGQDARASRSGGLEAAAGAVSEARRARPGTEDFARERGRGEAAEWRALPGDVAVPSGVRLDPGGLAAAEGSRAAEAVARIERIAEQSLRAAEVRLGPGGSAQARLELDLGALGQLRVTLDRNAEGALAIRFERAGPEAARLLVDHGAELVTRLEARGLALREVALANPDGSLVRVGSAVEPTAAEIASRAAGDPASARDETSREWQEDQRRRRPAEPQEEDEE
jgi:hypothetical protein